VQFIYHVLGEGYIGPGVVGPVEFGIENFRRTVNAFRLKARRRIGKRRIAQIDPVSNAGHYAVENARVITVFLPFQRNHTFGRREEANRHAIGVWRPHTKLTPVTG